MRFHKIRKSDISNAPGICATLFVQGCSRHCAGCFNQVAQDFTGGKIWNRRVKYQFLDICAKTEIKNVCILGGEPLEQDNDLAELLEQIKKETKKPIWLWTGYTWEEVYKDKNLISQQNLDTGNLIRKKILNSVDVLIDGPYIESLSDKSLKYRGSSNQRIIDVQKSIKAGKVIERADLY